MKSKAIIGILIVWAAMVLLVAPLVPTPSQAQSIPPLNTKGVSQSQGGAPEGQCQVTINIVEEPAGYIAGAGGGALRINPTFNANLTQAQRNVIQFAINEWQAIIQARGRIPDNYPISFQNGLAPGDGALARTTPNMTAAGDLVSASIGFSTNFTWFVDPTPGDDCEFIAGCCVPPACQPPTAVGFDLLTVARHELGHAIGHISGRRVTDLVSGGAFNPPRLNIAVVDGGSHTDPAWLGNDIMAPTVGPLTRRPISLYPASSLIARAYECGIPMQFVDPTHAGTEAGTALRPWRTMQTACTSSPAGTPLLLSNATHLVPVSFRCASRHAVNAARGVSVVRP